MPSRLSNLFKGLDEAQDRDQALVELTLERLDREDHDLAQLARLAAIPRRLDPDVIRVISESQNVGYSERLLIDLSKLTFVQARQDGGLVYHDSVRDVLLRQLRFTEQWKPAFETASRHLAEFYLERHDIALGSYSDLRAVAAVLRSANPRRLLQVSETAERALMPPMLEALYHASLLDAEVGFRTFERLFEFHEKGARLAACRALMVGIQNFLQEFWPQVLQEKQPWMVFWQGRLDLRLGALTVAEEALRSVVAKGAGNTPLLLAGLGALADCLKQQSRLGEARDLYREQLRVGEKTGEDLDVVRSAYFAIGELEYRLGELAAAGQSFFGAMEFAVERGEWGTLAAACGVLGLTLLEMGQPREGGRYLFLALDTARGPGRAEPQAGRTLALSTIELLKHRHARLVDTLVEESAALSTQTSDPSDDLPALVEELGRLVGVGYFEQADGLFSAAMEIFEASPEARAGAEFLNTAASLREGQGRLDEAAAFYGQVIDRAEDGMATPEQVALARTNRGDVHARMGRLVQGRTDLVTALREWERIGHRPLSALTRVNLADLALREGRPDEADRLLDEAESGAQRHPLYLADHQRVQARVLRHRGCLADALAAFRRARELYEVLGILDRLPLTLAEWAATAAEFADWKTAALVAQGAADVASQLAERNAHRPSTEAKELDTLNAKAIRTFYGLLADDEATRDHPPLDAARQMLSECVRREPENLWYRLNLAYVAFAAHDWLDAGGHFDAAVQLDPDLLDGSPPTDRALDCLIAAGDDKLSAGEPDVALTSYGEAEERLRARDENERLGHVLIRLGDAHLRAGRLDVAENAYAEVELLASDSHAVGVQATALARRGTLQADGGKIDEALHLLRRSLELRHAAGSSAAYWEMLRDCSKLGEPYVNNKRLNHLLRDLRNDPETGAKMRNFKPRLAAKMPADWYAKESITLLAPDGGANVIASSEPLVPTLTTREYADIQGNLLSDEFAEYEQQSFGPAELLGGREALIRRFSWRPPEGEPVTQIQLYHVEGARGYTVTATTPSNRFAELELQLRQVLEGLVIEDR